MSAGPAEPEGAVSPAADAPAPPWQEPAALRALSGFLQGWRFPVLTLSALGTFAALLVLLLVLPGGGGGMGAFVDEFRQWCFGWDPATGRMEWGYVLMALLSPTMLAGMIGFVWLDPLRAAARGPRAPVARMAALGAFLVLLSCGGLAAFPQGESGELPFPAHDLRTSLPFPEFQLTDQSGGGFAPSDARGKVLLVTAVYSRCPATCPMILAGAREALAALSEEERAEIVLVAVTLDPASDRPATLHALAEAHGLRLPSARFLTGDAADVERTLDALGISRTTDPVTGRIDHANLFLLVDRDGRLAYRLSLGERRQAWLVAGLRTLVAEPGREGA